MKAKKMNVDEYDQLIKNTVIQENQKELSQSFQATRNYVNGLLPKKLYRFRKCNELNFDALYKDQVWFSSGSEMNDAFDARLSYDVDSIRKWLHSYVLEDGSLIPVEVVKKLGTLPDEISQILPQSKDVISWINKMSKEELVSYSQQVVQVIENDIDSGLKTIESRVRNRTKFACFTERINSDLMWGIYSDNASGFALEYRFDDNCIPVANSDKNCQIGNLLLFPILYKNKRLDGTEYAKYLYQIDLLMRLANYRGIIIPRDFINKNFPNPDTFMSIKLAVYKSADWKSEKEWRLFYLNNNIEELDTKHLPVTMKASKIYLGRKIKDVNKRIILNIAREKGLEVYQMKFSKNPKTYRLISGRIF